MMHLTGVTSMIFRKLFPWIARIGHRFRRRVPAMLNEGVKQKLSKRAAGEFFCGPAVCIWLVVEEPGLDLLLLWHQGKSR